MTGGEAIHLTRPDKTSRHVSDNLVARNVFDPDVICELQYQAWHRGIRSEQGVPLGGCGFALIAWPEDSWKTGVLTSIVNHYGIVRRGGYKSQVGS